MIFQQSKEMCQTRMSSGGNKVQTVKEVLICILEEESKIKSSKFLPLAHFFILDAFMFFVYKATTKLTAENALQCTVEKSSADRGGEWRWHVRACCSQTPQLHRAWRTSSNHCNHVGFRTGPSTPSRLTASRNDK